MKRLAVVAVDDCIVLKTSSPNGDELSIPSEVPAHVVEVGDTWMRIEIDGDCALHSGTSLVKGQLLTLELGSKNQSWRRAG